MSYETAKGSSGEREVAEFLTNLFKDFGFKFVRVGGAEKNKKILAGDVVLDYRTDPNRICVLRNYYLEVKKQARPNIWADARKAQDDAEWWGKRGYILFSIKSAKGEHINQYNAEKLITMSWQTFSNLIKDLQNFYGSQE